MTSGITSSFPTHKIWVNREKRQRKELVGIEELAKSIKENGLIHFPVIKRDGELIVGERRWTAIKSLGWTDTPVQFVEDLDEAELHMIELEENIRRVDIPWKDQVLAMEQYHALCKVKDSDWSLAKTAEALGTTPEKVGQHIAIAEELKAGNERVAAAPLLSTARNIVHRQNARAAANALAEITERPKVKTPFLNVSFHDWEAAYTGTKFNFIHCDFPYGVNADKHAQGAADDFGGYADGFEIYTALLDRLESAMSNVVAQSAHLMFWFSMDYYQFTKERLEQMGWRVNPFPIIWHKSDNTGILPDPQRGPRRIYETAFIASRGDRLVVQSVSNVHAFPGQSKTVHMSEKPIPMLKHFFRMFVDEHSRVLDPTCGSGNALAAAEELNADYLLGLELSPEFYAATVEAWRSRDV